MTNIKRFSGAIVCLLLFALILPVFTIEAEAKSYLSGRTDIHYDKYYKLRFKMESSFDASTQSMTQSLMNQWNQVAYSDTLQKVGTFSETSSTGGDDGNNYIYKQSIGGVNKGLAKVYGVTGQWMYVINSGTYKSVALTQEVDIVINTSFAFSNEPQDGEYDIYTVLLHEMGHIFGLQDLASDNGSVMYSVPDGHTRRNITTYDINSAKNRLVDPYI